MFLCKKTLLIQKIKNIIQLFKILKKTEKEQIYENIGNYDNLKERAGDEDPLIWLDNYVEELNKKQKDNNLLVIIEKYQNRLISKDTKRLFNGGYLFLQQIYYVLKLDKICKDIEEKYLLKFDLNNILSRFISLYFTSFFKNSLIPSKKVNLLFVM